MAVRYRNQPLPVAPGRAAPEAVEYHLLPKGTKAISKARRFTPQNGSNFSPTSNTTRIPLNSTGFLDGQHSYLSFKVTYTSAGGTNLVGLDGTAQSLINQIRIEGSDGSELERISNYNVLVNAMEDLQIGDDHAQTLMNAFEGAPVLRKAVDSTQFGAGAAAGVNRTYSIKLMTAFLNNEKYLPLNFVAGGGVVLEITWDPNPNNVLITTGATEVVNYAISEVAYVGQVIEMDSQFNESFRALLEQAGGIDFHGATYREHTYTYEAADGGRYSIPVAERAKSIKSMFLVQRAQAQFDKTQRTMSNRSLIELANWQTKWGGAVYPAGVVNVSLDNPGESLAELVKAITSLGNIQQGSAMQGSNYTLPYDDDATHHSPSQQAVGFIGLDVEAFANASSVTDVGIDSASLALPISWELQLAASVAHEGVVHCNTYCLCDVIFTLDRQGLLSVSI